MDKFVGTGEIEISFRKKINLFACLVFYIQEIYNLHKSMNCTCCNTIGAFAFGRTGQRIFCQIGKEIHTMDVDPHSRSNLIMNLAG